MPPLRQRKEEIPWLIADAIRAVKPDLSPHVSLIEMCMLRTWPAMSASARGDQHGGDQGGRRRQRLLGLCGTAQPFRRSSDAGCAPVPADPTPASGVSMQPAPMSTISSPSTHSCNLAVRAAFACHAAGDAAEERGNLSAAAPGSASSSHPAPPPAGPAQDRSRQAARYGPAVNRNAASSTASRPICVSICDRHAGRALIQPGFCAD